MESFKPNESSDASLHFLDYWRIIRIRKTVILAVFLLVVLTTTAVTFMLPKSYSSMVRISVTKDSSDIAGLTGIRDPLTFDPYFVQTEFQKIKSKKILHKVIEDLNLNQAWAEEFGGGQPLKTQESYRILESLVDVDQTRNTSLIEISALSKDPEEAMRIANKIAEVYQETRTELLMSASLRGIDALDEELRRQNEKIEEAQQVLNTLRDNLQVTDFMMDGTTGSTIEPETVRRMELQRTEATSNYVRYKSLYDSLKGKTGDDLIKTVSFATPGTQLPNLLNELYQAEQQLASMDPDLGPKNPNVLRLTELKKELEKQIQDEVDSVMQGLQAQVTAHKAQHDLLQQEVIEAKEKDSEMAIKYRPYFEQKRKVEQMKRIRDAVLLRMIQEKVDSSIPKASMVEIIDKAEAALKPVRPNIPINIALGVIVGLVLGVGLAFFIEYLDTSVKTIDDVEKALQAPVLGVIPQNVGSLVEEGMDSPHAEAYRVLRTNVLFSKKSESATTLTVVSGGAGEGKSTTIFNLAAIFAQNGSRVLLVDSDLRRPSLHKILNVSNSVGLTNYLTREKNMEEVVQTTEIPTLDFLPSGKLPSSSMGILNSMQMKKFIQETKTRYDYVFFDSPPIMGVSDASILASESDMSLLVIQYRKYPQAMTVRAKQMVEKVGGNLLGVVLNNINISQDSYYYYYSGYYYDYYSKNEEQEPETAKKNGEPSNPAEDRGKIDLKPKY